AVNTGIAVAVVENGEITFFKGYGYADRVAQTPVTRDTVFRIASNTKAFAATMLMKLQEDGLVNIHLPVRAYLPEFTLESEPVSALATPVDLMSHQVGLPRHDLMAILTPYSQNQIFDRFRFLEMNKAPGNGFREAMQYNNLMYMTVGMIIEKVLATEWYTALRYRFLEPLGMTSTTTGWTDLMAAPDHALPYKGEIAIDGDGFDRIGAAGTMNSNVTDLAKWLAMFQNGGQDKNGAALISPDSLAQMWTKRSEFTSPDKSVHMEYGLGFALGQMGGESFVWHTGNLPGYVSLVANVPARRLGLIILANQADGAAFQWPFGTEALPTLIYQHLMQFTTDPSRTRVPDLREPNIPSIGRFTEAKLKAVAQDSLVPRRAFQAVYNEPAYGEIWLTQTLNGTRVLRYYGVAGELVATPEVGKYTMAFSKFGLEQQMDVWLEESDGTVTAVKIPFEPAVRPIRFAL
ncbi:MAG TPA: serine hydrolase domain-containing protein, partial [Bdellovibrionales bacterium]|nr:serine hydrolase domain-containing protein [Bdellovibrionales bacterium]